MRATMRITWLLLSLCFLFHGACPDDVTSSVMKTGADATSKAPVTVTAVAPTTTATQPPTATASKPVTTTVATTKPTDKPTTAPPQTSPVTNPPTTTTPAATTNLPGTVSVKIDASTAVATTTIKPVSTPPAGIAATAAAATPAATAAAATPAKTAAAATPAKTADNSGGSVVTPTAAATQTPGVGSNTSGTKVQTSPGNPGITKATNAPTAGHQPNTHFTFTTKTSQHSKGGTQGTTVMATSLQPTASKAPEPAGKPVTTSDPSTPTKTGPTAAQTFATKAAATSPQPTTTTSTTAPTTAARPKTFSYSLNTGHEKEEEKDLVEVCRRLMVTLQDGNCTLIWKHNNGKIQFDSVEINGKVKTSLATQYYEEITKKPTDNKTLIAILASCGALLIMIVILAVCASHHRKPYHGNQQHLTEELHTVENGYHDNPTLEVMEVQPEMQEKKMALNGEFNDSWIVPIDNLLKEDIADEEDTHL